MNSYPIPYKLQNLNARAVENVRYSTNIERTFFSTSNVAMRHFSQCRDGLLVKGFSSVPLTDRASACLSVSSPKLAGAVNPASALFVGGPIPHRT